MRPLKLMHKLLLLSLIPIIISLIIFGTISLITFQNSLKQSVDREIIHLASFTEKQITDAIKKNDTPQTYLTLINLKDDDNINSVYLIGPNGDIIADGTNANEFQGIYDKSIVKLNKTQDTIITYDDAIEIIRPINISNKIYFLKIKHSLKDRSDIKNKGLFILSYIGIIIILLIISINWSFSKSISESIETLKNAAHKIKKGDYNIEALNIRSYDEIGELAATFYEMAQEIKLSKKILEKNAIKLQNKIDELEKFHNLTVDREIKMIEMKRTINELKQK